VRPCRDYSPDGFQRKSVKRWAWRARRIATRLDGLRRSFLRDIGLEAPHTVPVYRDLARRAWR
jgi:hypothetical protein